MEEIETPDRIPATDHNVTVTFQDSNRLDGMQIVVGNVSAEQLFVAAAYLERISNRLLSMMEAAAQQTGKKLVMPTPSELSAFKRKD